MKRVDSDGDGVPASQDTVKVLAQNNAVTSRGWNPQTYSSLDPPRDSGHTATSPNTVQEGNAQEVEAYSSTHQSLRVEKLWHVHVPAVYHQQTAWHRLPLFVSVKRRRKPRGMLKFIRSRWPSYILIKVFQIENKHSTMT